MLRRCSTICDYFVKTGTKASVSKGRCSYDGRKSHVSAGEKCRYGLASLGEPLQTFEGRKFSEISSLAGLLDGSDII